tara:strand:- start:12 stop:176 length:165 start_codon:yes stop_codon:yes gene_type:complete
MNLEAGIRFIFFLVFFGFANYLIMLRRYEANLEKKRFLQKLKISKLYPKGTYIF